MITNNKSTKLIPSKWEFTADKLKQRGAPDDIVNAAIEIDNLLISLNLGYNTQEWINDYNHIFNHEFMDVKKLQALVYNTTFCSACDDCMTVCEKCKLGNIYNCTPSPPYPKNYFRIVNGWISKQTIK